MLIIFDSFDICTDSDDSKNQIEYVLVLRRWISIKPNCEFRCFVKQHILFGISQREIGSHYDFLVKEKANIEQKLVQFYEEKVKNKFPDPDCRNSELF